MKARAVLAFLCIFGVTVESRRIATHVSATHNVEHLSAGNKEQADEKFWALETSDAKIADLKAAMKESTTDECKDTMNPATCGVYLRGKGQEPSACSRAKKGNVRRRGWAGAAYDYCRKTCDLCSLPKPKPVYQNTNLTSGCFDELCERMPCTDGKYLGLPCCGSNVAFTCYMSPDVCKKTCGLCSR